MAHANTSMKKSRSMAPLSRRKFNHFWDELDHCCQKAHHYMYVCGKKGLARRYVLRMRVLLPSAKGHPDALVGARARALCWEYAGRWGRGAICREAEMDLVLRLHKELSKRRSARVIKFVSEGYGRSEVRVRLAAIYREYKDKATPSVIARLQNVVARARAWAW